LINSQFDAFIVNKKVIYLFKQLDISNICIQRLRPKYEQHQVHGRNGNSYRCEYMITRKSYGLYVVGNGMCIPVDDAEDAKKLLEEFTSK